MCFLSECHAGTSLLRPDCPPRRSGANKYRTISDQICTEGGFVRNAVVQIVCANRSHLLTLCDEKVWHIGRFCIL